MRPSILVGLIALQMTGTAAPRTRAEGRRRRLRRLRADVRGDAEGTELADHRRGRERGGDAARRPGRDLQEDGKTPAPGVILYVYQTDVTGALHPRGGQVQGKRHGRLRGWMKTGADGRYRVPDDPARPVSRARRSPPTSTRSSRAGQERVLPRRVRLRRRPAPDEGEAGQAGGQGRLRRDEGHRG